LFAELLFVSVCPVIAANTEYVSKDTFWNWAAGSNGVIKQVINFVGGLGTCSKSEDTYHHASTYFHEGNVNGEVRYRCICDYCGDSFTAYASDLEQSYDAQVSELPATGFTSEGNLIWSPSFSDCSSSKFELQDWEGTSYRGPEISRDASTYSSSDESFIYEKLTSHSARVTRTFKSAKKLSGIGFKYFYFYFPFNCSYKLLSTSYIQGSYRDSSGVLHSFSCSYTAGSFYHANTTDSVMVEQGNINRALGGAKSIFYISSTIYMPQYLVAPDATLPGDTYNITSRPTSITGDYGIIGDNGQITKVEGNTIVNETNNTYYNPATGETSTITDWSYNYEDRSYTLTLGGGTTTTVTYGDENVTIQEGDTTYNVYYLVDGSGTDTPNPVPTTCDHTWTETGRTEPTCSIVGKVTSTCSKCGQSKTETIPALGHTWTVDRTVQTTYDEEGNLLQQGYTIYRCTVCGEQYKDQEGTGPPGQEDGKSLWEQLGDLIGSGLGGLVDLVEAVLSKILDALIALVDMLMGKLKTVVESILSIFDELPALFGGFLDFLAAVFPFLPPELMTILTFGVIAIVVIGIIKAVRR